MNLSCSLAQVRLHFFQATVGKHLCLLMAVLFPIILLTCIDPLEAVVGQVSGPKLILDMPHHFRVLNFFFFLLTDLHHSASVIFFWLGI